MTSTFATAFAALILTFACILLAFIRYSAESRAAEALDNVIRTIRNERLTTARFANSEQWEEVREAVALQNLAMVVVDDQGHVLHRTAGKIPSWPNPDRHAWRLQAVPLDGGTAVIGFFWTPTEQSLRQQEGALVGFCALIFVSATLCARLLVKRTLSPIFRLSQQADTASMDSLRLRLYAPSHDEEIVHLVNTLNGLLSRVSGAITARSRFYAAASHELRTPLQTLTGYLDVALMHRREVDEYEEILHEATLQTVRLTSLVQALLLLNQLDAASLPDQESVDLAEICDRCLRNLNSDAAARGLQIDLRLPQAAQVQAVPSYAEILIRNLLDNAFKYANLTSHVGVTLESSGSGFRLAVFNMCETIADWDQTRLFEPFYRMNTSRNSNPEGNGLGLAICKAIADVNGWTISLTQQSDGVLAEVLFPTSG